MRSQRPTSRTHTIEVRHTDLQDEKDLLEATPVHLYTVPTQMITDNSALATVAAAGAPVYVGQPTGYRHNADVSCPIVLHGRRRQLWIGF
eukprot:8816274-Pyramimonas_sp.AAC.1